MADTGDLRGTAGAEVADPFWGKLTWDIFPFYDPIIFGTFIGTCILGAAVVGAITYYRLWGYLWNEWFTSVDHKKIGIMYMVLATVMLLRGFADALLMRGHQALASAGYVGYLPAYHYDQVFTAHGVIMIFFVAMPFITGFMNYVMPLQIGARDVAFPFLNNFSFWLTVSGAVLIMVSLFVGEFAATGWLAYPPLSGLTFSPGVGMDYYLWSLNIAGIGTTLSGINLIVTLVKMRAPGMTWMKMPVFCWTTLCTNVLIVATFPVLSATLALLTADRYLDTNFFTNELGGNPMMYVNLIWIWGHPEVYILTLPVFGIFSEVVPTFTGKRLFGYTSMVYATCVIMILSYIVWLHHFFTMGAGADVNSFFGITTMIISIPTGAKIFNWLFTMYKGRIRFEVPMLWVMGFMITFTIGGMTGVLLAIPPADYVLHNSLFLVAHFHNVIIGGVVFGIFAGINYWWPKAFGFKLDPFWGKVSFWGWFFGMILAFAPLYVLGLMGVTRRLSSFEDTVYSAYFFTAAIGALLVLVGVVAFVVQIVVSIAKREELRDETGDPWDARTLEWSTTSPPPHYNFAFTPKVYELDAWTHMKRAGFVRPDAGYTPIHMPHNTASGIVISGLMTVMGFALIWHIWWMAALFFLASLAYGIAHTFNYNRDYYIPIDEVRATEGVHPQMPRAARMTPPVDIGYTEEFDGPKDGRPAAPNDFFVVEDAHDDAHAHHETGTLLGFWLYLMSDCLIFGILFAVHAVVGQNYAAGPSPADLFDIELVLIATFALLFSSITYGFAMINMGQGNQRVMMLWLAITGVFGLIFLGMTIYEFDHLIHIGATPMASAFLSSFFVLVGTHALHVAAGCLWLVVLLVQVKLHGLTEANRRRVMCLSLFWHFLDLIWIGVFSFVYLTGVLL